MGTPGPTASRRPVRAPTQEGAPRRSALGHAFRLGAVLLGALALVVTGLSWGIPSRERARFYFEDPILAAREDPHSLALKSYHPDEPIVFMVLNRMRPAELDFNPRSFQYPTLYFYSVGATLQLARWLDAITLTNSKEFYFRDPDEIGRLYLVARMTTATFALMTLLACYGLAREGYDRRVALLATLFLAVFPLFVVHSHYATVDVPVTFWITASLGVALAAIQTGRRRWYALSGLAAGLATATKYYGGVAVVPLLVGHALRGRAPRSTIVTAIALVPVGFLLGCPYAALAPRDFLNGLYVILDAQLIGQEAYEDIYGHFAWPFFYHLYLSLPHGMGLALLGLGLAGCVWAARRRTSADVVLLAFVVAYYGLIGVSFLRPMRYAMPLLPPLAVLAARLALDVRARFHDRGWGFAARGWTAAVVCAAAFSLFVSIAYVRLMVSPDPRDEAAVWLAEHAPAGARIGLIFPPTYRTPPLDSRRYDLRVVGFDRETVARDAPDYVVMSEIETRDYLRAIDRYPSEGAFVRDLLSGRFTAGGAPYRVFRFQRHPEFLGWDLKPALAPHDALYVSPDVYVLGREARP